LATGLLLVVAPAIVIEALIGPTAPSATIVGRVLGGALLTLGVAGISSIAHPDWGVRLAYVLYDFATATILISAGLGGEAGGALLWPVVTVHVALGTALLVTSMLNHPVPRLEGR
jgi:hypothetical protein